MARLNMVMYPTFGDLTGTSATLDDLVSTISPLPREEAFRVPIHILNSLAADVHLKDEQIDLIGRLEPALKEAYKAFLAAAEPDEVFRPFHPLQQLVFLHAASRYCAGTLGSLTAQEVEQRFTRACFQINDFLLKASPDDRHNTILYMFSENGPHADLINNSHPMQSLGRLRHLLIEMYARGGVHGEAAGRLRQRFPEYLGLPFETAFNLTAFLIFTWHLYVKDHPDTPGSCYIDRRTWLTNSAITREQLDAYLDRISTSPDELVKQFGDAMTFHNVMPFRQRPLLKVDENIVGFICPQFVIEKGGIDLFWLLTNETPGVHEGRLWTDDFGSLIEGYVHDIISGLPGAAVGGHYDSFIPWTDSKKRSGEIDGLIHDGELLVLIETKGSLLRQAVLSTGDEKAVQQEIEKKFVGGEGNKAKGLSQLTRAIECLAVERKYGRTFRGIDLGRIKWIIPVLFVADRSLRFPLLARWFNQRFGTLLGKNWGRIGPLVLCSLEDLEAMEQRAVDGHGSLVSTFAQYAKEYPRAEGSISDVIGPRQNQRLRGLANGWIEELERQRILPRH